MGDTTAASTASVSETVTQEIVGKVAEVVEPVLDSLLSLVPGNPTVFLPEEKEAIHLGIAAILKMVGVRATVSSNVTAAAPSAS